MTMIVPAGNNKLDWSPKETKLQKVASEGQEGQDIELDALYEAARGVVQASEEEKKCEDCECDPCECEEKDDSTKEACGEMKDEEAIILDVEEVPAEEVAEEVSEEVPAEEVSSQSVSEAVAEVEAKAEEAEALVEKVEEAVDKIEEAVQGVKEVCGSGEAEEVEFEVSEEAEGCGECEEAEGIPGEEETDDEVIVEGFDKAASAEEFCKYAKLSGQNRKKLKDYWTNMLGYPKDFVDLMTKDYEK